MNREEIGQLERPRPAKNYSFRLRFALSKDRLPIDAKSVDLTERELAPMVCLTSNKDVIAKASEIVVRGVGYSSEREAHAAGEIYRDAVIIALTRQCIGADFGDRAPHSAWTGAGLRYLGEQWGRTLNDVHGLMVFESDPPPRFARTDIDLQVNRNRQMLLADIREASSRPLVLTIQQRLAYDLFSASMFTRSSDARFLMLWMALETLIGRKRRSQEACDLVSRLMATTRAESGLAPNDRDSIAGGLAMFFWESTRQAGRKLSTQLIGHRYGELEPERFFTNCYDLRSKLAHGEMPRPTRETVDSLAAGLERFVSDLLCRLIG